MLEIQNLRVDYPDLLAVDGISFTVEPGDGFALVGPNGAGKTSTFRAIAGLLEPTHGNIRINGVDSAANPRAFRAQLGYMPDDPPLIDGLTASQFLEHFARAYEVPNRTQRIADCLDATGLTAKADADCKSLSRGMRQRLVLSRTLLHDPPVLVLDEPASGLDPLSRRDLRAVLNTLRERGKSILVSSHILSEIAEFCNKVGVLENGALKACGRIDAIASELTQSGIRLAWREAGPSPIEALTAHPKAKITERRPGFAEFDFGGGPEALDALLAGLVTSGVRVTEWRNVTQDLEHVFMKLGAREVR